MIAAVSCRRSSSSEVALALVLLVSAGLLIRSFTTLANVDPGIRERKRRRAAGVPVRVALPDRRAATGVLRPGYRAHSRGRRASNAPVSSPRCRSAPPTSTSRAASKSRDGRSCLKRDRPSTFLTVATADYFRRRWTFDLKQGRVFSDEDRRERHTGRAGQRQDRRAVLAGRESSQPAHQRQLARAMANACRSSAWSPASATRRSIAMRAPKSSCRCRRSPFGSLTFVVRTTGDAAAMIPALRSRIWEVDGSLADLRRIDGERAGGADTLACAAIRHQSAHGAGGSCLPAGDARHLRHARLLDDAAHARDRHPDGCWRKGRRHPVTRCSARVRG